MADPNVTIVATAGSSYWRETLAKYAVIGVAFHGVAMLALSASGLGHDDTDKPGERSGMTPLTDNLTGCQYLSRGSGLTPRLTVDGKQMGCR